VSEDDLLRRALREPAEPVSSYRVLQDLRPTMRRARTRRRAGVGAAAAILLAGVGAGALALTSSTPPTVRTTPASDENGAAAPTLPTVPEPDDGSEGEALVVEPTPVTVTAETVAPVTQAPPTPSPASEDDEQPEMPGTSPMPRSPAAVPAPTATTTPPPTGAPPVAPPPATAAPTSHVLTSECGEVVVTIDGQTVRIASITPLPGYSSQIETNGPESVEMKFRGADRTCEIHAELKSAGLDVEVQASGDDD
jgi:hypothetical protein